MPRSDQFVPLICISFLGLLGEKTLEMNEWIFNGVIYRLGLVNGHFVLTYSCHTTKTKVTMPLLSTWNNMKWHENCWDRKKNSMELALGQMPLTEILLNKQPTVAITIQIEFSYFSCTNLSFLTHRNSGPATEFWVNYWSSRSPVGWSGRPVVFLSGIPYGKVQVDSAGALGGSAPETLRCPLVHFHLEASVWLKSYSTRKANSSEHRTSDPRFIQHRSLSMSEQK